MAVGSGDFGDGFAPGDLITGPVPIPAGVIPPWDHGGGPYKTEEEAAACCQQYEDLTCVGCEEPYQFPADPTLVSYDRTLDYTTEFPDEAPLSGPTDGGSGVYFYQYGTAPGTHFKLLLTCLEDGSLQVQVAGSAVADGILRGIHPVSAGPGWTIDSSTPNFPFLYRVFECGDHGYNVIGHVGEFGPPPLVDTGERVKFDIA